MRKSLLILCVVFVGTQLGNAESIQHLADSSFHFEVRPEYRVARLPSVLESVRDSQVDLIDLPPKAEAPRQTAAVPVEATPASSDASVSDTASDEVAKRVNPLRPQRNVPRAAYDSSPILAANPNAGSPITSRRLPASPVDDTTRLQRLVSALNGEVEAPLPEFPNTPPFTTPTTYGGLKPSTVSPAPPIGSLKPSVVPPGVSEQMSPAGTQDNPVRTRPAQSRTVPTATATATQSDGSILAMIANRSLLQGQTRYRMGLIQLQATALRYERNVRSTGYQVINKSHFANRLGFWSANEASGQPLLNESTHRLYANYLQGTPTASVPASTVFQILKADLHTTEPQLVQAVIRKLDAVANVYWQLVAERGKLIAATDHAKFCENVLSSVRRPVDMQQDNLYTQARAAYDRSLVKQNDAFSRTVAVQQRLIELVGDPSLIGKVELIPTDLPRSESLDSLQKQLSTANANRDSTIAGAYGVNLDIQMAHRELTNALQQVNRSLKAVSEASTAIADISASLETLGAANALTLTLNKQENLYESQLVFLSGLADQQLAITEMKRANGTLVRTEYLHSNSVATIDLTTPSSPAATTQATQTPSVTPQQSQTPPPNPTSASNPASLLRTSPSTTLTPAAQTQSSKWQQKPTATFGRSQSAASVANPFAAPAIPQPQPQPQPRMMPKKTVRSPVNRTTTPLFSKPRMRTSSKANGVTSAAKSWLSRLTGAK